MNTSIHNRNESFASIVSKLPEKRRRVLELIEKYENASAQQLAELTMTPINEITGRITELKKAFLIVETGSKQNRFSHKKNTTYRVVKSVAERIDLINVTIENLKIKREKLEKDSRSEISQFGRVLIEKELIKIRGRFRSLEVVLASLG